MIVIERGNVKQIGATFKNSALVDTDPVSNLAYVTIYYKDGTTKLASTAMTKSATGIYYYNWTTLSTDSIGMYIIEIIATFATSIPTVNRTTIYLGDLIEGN